MKLNSHLSENGRIAILKLDGRFDAYEVASVRQWLEETIPAKTSQIVINLEKVSFIDSTGLATFVQGMKNCRNEEGDLILCGLQRSVRVIFELTRLDRAFEIFETEAEAVQAFSAQAATTGA